MERNIRIRVVLEHMDTHEIKMIEVDFESICHGDSEILDLEFFNGYSGTWNIISTDLSTGKYDEFGKELFENDISYHGIVEWVENEDVCGFQFRDFEYERGHLRFKIEGSEKPEILIGYVNGERIRFDSELTIAKIGGRPRLIPFVGE